MRSFWPGIYGNSSGSSLIVSKMRKRALLVARFMLQMIQVPLLSKESKEDESNKVNSESHSCSFQMSDDFDDGMEGIAIRIAAEVKTITSAWFSFVAYPSFERVRDYFFSVSALFIQEVCIIDTYAKHHLGCKLLREENICRKILYAGTVSASNFNSVPRI